MERNLEIGKVSHIHIQKWHNKACYSAVVYMETYGDNSLVRELFDQAFKHPGNCVYAYTFKDTWHSWPLRKNTRPLKMENQLDLALKQIKILEEQQKVEREKVGRMQEVIAQILGTFDQEKEKEFIFRSFNYMMHGNVYDKGLLNQDGSEPQASMENDEYQSLTDGSLLDEVDWEEEEQENKGPMTMEELKTDLEEGEIDESQCNNIKLLVPRPLNDVWDWISDEGEKESQCNNIKLLVPRPLNDVFDWISDEDEEEKMRYFGWARIA